MWKDFFYYSRSERRAVYFLLFLIALLLVAIIFYSKRDNASSDLAENSAEVDSFLADVKQGRNILRKNQRMIVLMRIEQVFSLNLIQIQPIPSNFLDWGCLLMLLRMF